MPMTDDDRQETRLEAAFEAARAARPEPSAELMARVLADAEAAQAGFAPAPAPRPRSGYLRQFFETLGGWPAMAGLTAAGVAGIWLGVSPDVGLSDALASYLGAGDTASYTVDVMPGAELGLAWDEGAL
ncbi:hypothetical protein [Roseovarius bejariae]|nr:hypothetical protein [Roseovarius bejariae]